MFASMTMWPITAPEPTDAPLVRSTVAAETLPGTREVKRQLARWRKRLSGRA